jgi:flagellar biosynthetic protein FliQ
MTQSFVLTVLSQAIILTLMLSAPMLITGLIIGFVVALLQTVTSIQEQTLSFVPKALGVFVVLILTTPWMMVTAIGYLQRLYANIPAMVGTP